MTLARQEPAGAPDEPPTGSGRYHISLERLEQLGRSARHIIADRLTEACPSYKDKGRPAGLDVMVMIREIKEFHDDAPEFIRADMPIQEILFRTLLARGNEPMPISEMRLELTDRWSSPLRLIALDEARLRRVLVADKYYGFAEV